MRSIMAPRRAPERTKKQRRVINPKGVKESEQVRMGSEKGKKPD